MFCTRVVKSCLSVFLELSLPSKTLKLGILSRERSDLSARQLVHCSLLIAHCPLIASFEMTKQTAFSSLSSVDSLQSTVSPLPSCNPVTPKPRNPVTLYVYLQLITHQPLSLLITHDSSGKGRTLTFDYRKQYRIRSRNE